MIIRTLVGAAAATLFLSDSAFALSCMRADASQAMEAAKSSDDLYYILVGTFQSTQAPKIGPKSKVDPKNRFETSKPTIVEAWFDGRILSNTASGDTPVSRFPVDVEITCAGPWCGSAPSNGTEVISFVKVRPGLPMLLSAGPCPDKVFAASTERVSQLRDCFDKNCKSEPDARFDKR